MDMSLALSVGCWKCNLCMMDGEGEGEREREREGGREGTISCF